MKRKILFLIESLSGGGAEKVLTVLLKHFDYEKYEVTICPVVDTGVYCDEVKSYVVSYQPIVSYHGNCFSRLLNKIKYKLVYSILPLSVVYKWFVPKDNDVEIAFCEGFVTKLLSHAKSDAFKVSWLHTNLTTNPWPITLGIYKDIEEEKQAYSKFNRIVCVSKTVEQSFQKRYGLEDHTCTIYNPIDVDDIWEKAGKRSQVNDDIFRIISIGRLVPQKGYDRLLHVIRQLYDDGINLHLLILGEGTDRAALEKYICKNNMQSYVCLPGFDKNPYRHLVNSDLFICSSRAEGFSLVIAEAMALSVPVLSTYCSGPNELLGDGKYGLLVDNTENGLLKGLEKAISEKKMMEEYANKAKMRLAEFAPINIINQIEEIL